MTTFLVVIWILCGIIGFDIGMALDGCEGRWPTGLTLLVLLGPCVLFFSLLECVQRATRNK